MPKTKVWKPLPKRMTSIERWRWQSRLYERVKTLCYHYVKNENKAVFGKLKEIAGMEQEKIWGPIPPLDRHAKKGK